MQFFKKGYWSIALIIINYSIVLIPVNTFQENLSKHTKCTSEIFPANHSVNLEREHIFSLQILLTQMQQKKKSFVSKKEWQILNVRISLLYCWLSLKVVIFTFQQVAHKIFTLSTAFINNFLSKLPKK